MSRTRPLCIVSIFFAFAAVVAGCGDDDSGDSAATTTSAAEGDTTAASDDAPMEGPVTIEDQVDFTFRPVTGTFEVTEGADVLGCSSGSFQDSGSPNEGGVARVYTCEAGSNEGSFTSDLSFLAEPNTESESGIWTIAEGSDDFVGLQGGGDWSLVYDADDPNVAVGSSTGDINYIS